MDKLHNHAGNYAWLALGAGVAAFEFLSDDKLSNAVDRALENPHTRYMTYVAIGVTALHLANLLPEPIDPYHYLAKFDRPIRSLAYGNT